MFNRTNLLTYISKFLVIVFLNVCRVKCETQCPLNFCTTFSIVVIKLLMWSLNYWRGYWTVVWSLNYWRGSWTVVWSLNCWRGYWTVVWPLNYWRGYWSVGWSLNWLSFLSCAHKTDTKNRKKKKEFDTRRLMKKIRNTHCLCIEVLIRVNWIRCGNYSKPGSAKLTNRSNNLKNGSTACN